MLHTSTVWRLDQPAEGFYTFAAPSDPGCVVHTFLPTGYLPSYAYPLLVLYAGDDAPGKVLELAPRISRRNYLAISVHGHAGDPVGRTQTALDQARQMYHVHPDRVTLVGLGAQGSADAFRAAFGLRSPVAGVVALDGNLPDREPGRPLFALDRVRRRRFFLAQSRGGASQARTRSLLESAGAELTLKRYAAGRGATPELLRDLNRWVMAHVTGDARLLRA